MGIPGKREMLPSTALSEVGGLFILECNSKQFLCTVRINLKFLLVVVFSFRWIYLLVSASFVK